MSMWIWLVFWFCLALLVYIYAGYALLLQLMAWLSPFKHEPDENFEPTISIVFAAHNERGSLPDKFASLKKLNYPHEKLQVLVASDASTDGTNEYLASLDWVEFAALQQHSGKNAALNAILPKATGELLFFTDANTILHPDCMKAVAKHFADNRVGMITGDLTFTLDDQWNPVGHGTGLYWRYENSLKRAENRLGSVLVGCGSLLSVRRSLVNPLHPQVANDLEIPTRVGAMGYAVLFEPECLGYEKPHTHAGEELARTSRIVARGVRGFVMLLPVMSRSPLRLWQFVSHKALRWFTLPLALMVWVCGALLMPHPLAMVVFTVGSIKLLAALLGLLFLRMDPVPRLLRPFTLLAHFLLMYAGATLGVLKAILGRAPATWNVPKSTRG